MRFHKLYQLSQMDPRDATRCLADDTLWRTRPWQNFLSPESETKFQRKVRKVTLFLEVPKVLYNALQNRSTQDLARSVQPFR